MRLSPRQAARVLDGEGGRRYHLDALCLEGEVVSPIRVALMSPCGLGNLGDALIQETYIRQLRERLGPHVEFYGLTLDPQDTRARHHIEGFPVYSWISANQVPVSPPRGRFSWMNAVARKGRFVVAELRHLRLVFRLMRQADVLIASGGGQLDDAWGGPMSHPLALAKWTLGARLNRVPVAVSCVGAGSLDSRWSRRFVRWTLRLANATSCRDPQTIEMLKALDVKAHLRLVPDAAHGYPADASVPSARPLHDPPVIGVSPIAYLSPSAWWPRQDEARYRDLVMRTADAIARLAQRGNQVRVFTTDSTDDDTAREVAQQARSKAGSSASRIEELETRDVDALLAAVRAMDIVIASRLHAVIVAQLMARPVLAVSYNWKVDLQMTEAGLGDFVVPILSFQPEDLLARVERIQEGAQQIRENLVALGRTRASALEKEFDLLAGLARRRSGAARSRLSWSPGLS
jgi:polysaccharide pyruvyl transferase WcaK-like protein